MTIKIESAYYVGKDQPYETINQAVNTIAAALGTNNYLLPSDSLSDGGQINIVIKGGGKFPPFRLPDNMTSALKAANRYLVIKRQEYLSNGELVSDSLPVITPMAQSGSEITEEDKLIGIDLGSNNPNVKIIGLRINGFIIGLTASFNCDNLYINRCFFTNSINAQVYIHDCDSVYLTNNVIVGGQYGIACKTTRNIRCYHNTIFLDGLTALDNTTKAGLILQGERLFGNSSPSIIYCLGNIVYTVGCPAAIFYEEDLKTNRLISNYNNYYSQHSLVQLRQDNATLPEDASDVIKLDLQNLFDWQQAGPLGSDNSKRVDQDSISIHPVFIQNITLAGSNNSSILNLGTIENSPMLAKVPSWYFTLDSFYVPSDFNEELISVDALLNVRQQPFTAIGSNDARSINGFFGQDIFTSPLSLDPTKKCDLDPLNLVSSQDITMSYPAIAAGYFWSHERPYYLYGKKGASTLGNIARTTFKLPGFLNNKRPIFVYAKTELLLDSQWDLQGRELTVFHRNTKITSYDDEVQVKGSVKSWYNNGFTDEDAFYIFKIHDGTTEFVLPKEYQPTGPVVITDDRISYLNPSDIVHREFKIDFDASRNENKIVFGGNQNLFSNGDFTSTLSGQLPTNWIAAPQTGAIKSVFMLANQYAYWGEYAVGLRLNSSPGYLISNKLKVSKDDQLCFSWHSRLPFGITGITGQDITSATGYYNITLFDNYDEVMQTSYNGSFVVNTSGFNRYYLMLGDPEFPIDLDLKSPNSAPLISLNTIPIQLPETVSSIELTISGANHSDVMSTGAFFVLDSMQAEYSIQPTHYHPQPDLNLMTIEYETDPSGIFIDKRMNVSSVFNENPNGFLYIADMPATIWNGPTEPEVTTLHEYRWQDGRIKLLPWSRLHGKDKLRQKTIFNDSLSEPQSIIAPYVFPREAKEAVINPSVIRLNQRAELSDGFTIQITDDIGNPYPLRNYVMHVYDQNGKFPGWLSKKYYGAKEQLGSTIYGSLNSNGSASAYYLSPSERQIRYVGFVSNLLTPTSGLSGAIDTIGTVKVPYNVSLENNGNITIIGRSGQFHRTVAQYNMSGQYIVETNNGTSFIVLEYPPVFGSVELNANSNTFSETLSDPQSEEFFVNYSFGHIELAAGIPAGTPVSIKYQPKYVYPNPSEPNMIIIHTNQVLSGYTGPVQIDYDAELKLEIRVANPLNREFVATFPIVVQNPQLSNIVNQSLSLEF